MSIKSERIESLSQALDEVGIIATAEQIEKIVNDFSLHLEMENELSSYKHIGYKEPCTKCESLEGEIERLRKENNIYNESVKRRRNASSVWIENNSVMYE